MGEVLIEQIVVYSTAFILCATTVFFYLRKKKVASVVVEQKVELAKEEGLFEPVSLESAAFLQAGTCRSGPREFRW